MGSYLPQPCGAVLEVFGFHEPGCSPGGGDLPKSSPRRATAVRPSARSTRPSTVDGVRRRAAAVPKNAGRWRRERAINRRVYRSSSKRAR